MSVCAPYFVAYNGADDRFVVPVANRINVIRKEGYVFGHDVTGNRTVGPAFGYTGSKVAYNGLDDRFVVAMGNRLIVIRKEGFVFGHDISGNNIGGGFGYTGSKVAYNGEDDRFVVAMGNRLIVIRKEGLVFGHDVSGNNVGGGFEFTGSKVAYNGADDRFVLAMGNRLIVIRKEGYVFGHDVNGTNIGNAFGFTGSKVAYNGADDRFVLAMGNRLIVIRKEGFVYGHDVNGTNISPPYPMNFVLGHFTFASDISTANRTRLLERHLFALTRVTACGRLSQQEKNDLISKGYDKAIHHTTLDEDGVNASAPVNGSQINVNFNVLFPQGDEEISQTLIHEMMHSAGYTHPTRRDAPAGMSCAAPDPRLFDCPNDNGVYYGTAPLRAEFCIAGDQSDVRTRLEIKTALESCAIGEDGVARLRIIEP